MKCDVIVIKVNFGAYVVSVFACYNLTNLILNYVFFILCQGGDI